MLSPIPVNKYDEYEEIYTGLVKAQDHLLDLKSKLVAKDMSADKALKFLYTYAKMNWIGGYLVCYVVDVPWYVDKPVLIEMLVLRLRPGGAFKDVTDFLEDQARLHQCNYVATGTSLAADDERTAKLYARQGYSLSAIQMIKEIDLCASD